MRVTINNLDYGPKWTLNSDKCLYLSAILLISCQYCFSISLLIACNCHIHFVERFFKKTSVDVGYSNNPDKRLMIVSHCICKFIDRIPNLTYQHIMI